MYTLRGKTSVYGRLNDIAMNTLDLETIQGQMVSIKVDELTSAALVDRIGELIGLRGIATWQQPDLLMVDFVFEELLPYHETPITEAMAALKEAVGSAYDWVETPQDLRDFRAWIYGEDNPRFDAMFGTQKRPL